MAIISQDNTERLTKNLFGHCGGAEWSVCLSVFQDPRLFFEPVVLSTLKVIMER